MKIDIVTDTFTPDVNGVAMTLGRLTDGMRRRGHRVHVVHTGITAGSGETCAAAVPLPGYKEVRVGLPKPFELRARWIRKRPDAIYIATESPLGRSALKAANALGIPVATGFHTNFHQYMRQYGMGGLQPMAMAYLKNFHQRAHCTLTPSRDVMERLAAEGIENVHLLGRGVDTELFMPAKRCENLRSEWRVRAGCPVAIMVGRVAPEKNFELAIATFQRMRELFPDMACVVVGDGPLREKLSENHPWIHFAGVKTGEDLAKYYASADVLVFPSETETFGNVLLEGMASGLTTVSFDYAAAALHVRTGANGLKAATGDGEQFIRHALHALSLPVDHDLRRGARQTAESLGWDSVIAEFEHRLSEIAGIAPDAEKKPAKPGKQARFSCRTVFLSDIHLGTPDSKADEVVDFLKHIDCRKLVLNGDIVDGWALRRGSRWTSRHSRLIRKVIKMTERDQTEVIYLRGNHDEILERFLPMSFGRIRLTKEHIHMTPQGKRYLVVHGDGFDSVSTNHRWLALLGAVGYDFLLRVNRFYNHYRAWCGKEYFSLSKSVKAKVKSAVSFVDRYEDLLQNLAIHRKCDGIICGHIHTPEDKQVGAVHYLNSGDWVESLTAIIEHHDGRMELVRHAEVIGSLRKGLLPGAEPAAESAWMI
ncbi:MAG: glycosyltransferase [Luteolibacter sp.]|jgi:UDP-2,3-diacylglucosamine pyrophosphatase LpxH/glycosyltransferase involved in cell wall biosynthesis|nr:glycosyltransferase [Luteolibacter sp.]